MADTVELDAIEVPAYLADSIESAFEETAETDRRVAQLSAADRPMLEKLSLIFQSEHTEELRQAKRGTSIDLSNTREDFVPDGYVGE